MSNLFSSFVRVLRLQLQGIHRAHGANRSLRSPTGIVRDEAYAGRGQKHPMNATSRGYEGPDFNDLRVALAERIAGGR